MTLAYVPQEWLARMQSGDSNAASAGRTSMLTILERIAAIPSERVLITIDGPCGSGKTTLASELSRIINAPVVHMDDFVIPHALKTAARLAIPGGNADAERLCSEVIHPWLTGSNASYRPYLCHSDSYGESSVIPASRYLIVEGSYSNLPPIAASAAFRIFLQITPELQQQRLMQRVGAERLADFNQRWIPLENAYFTAYRLPDAACHCVDAQVDQDV